MAAPPTTWTIPEQSSAIRGLRFGLSPNCLKHRHHNVVLLTSILLRYQERSQWVSRHSPQMMYNTATRPPEIPPDVKTSVPSHTPTWVHEPGNESRAKATWLGHASYLLELPSPPGAARGPRIIFDPVFSERCSPSQFIGPSRYTGIYFLTIVSSNIEKTIDVPCNVNDIPAVDIIVLSHNHYDHTDLPTLQTLLENAAGSTTPHIFVSLNNAKHLSDALNLSPDRVHDLDWWDERVIRLGIPSKNQSNSDSHEKTVEARVRLTCTPSQHTSGRKGYDRWNSLWGAWVVEELLPPSSPGNTWEDVGRKAYFAGDTGYRTVRNEEDEDTAEVCPAFRMVGERFGGVDVALLPIGAYAPRSMWSNLHASPGDAVRIMTDVRATRALAMHWGTWVLTSEPVLEPPILLRQECEKAGIAEDAFLVPALGETVLF
ncbi:hypothetical protein EW146_g807 [Bondarzewia mesenterica]|uniref:Metallo-beta-lactamase domain-containing protein n=1 Tax=Bondarzewia mesenterica TaxID=1095465 RepID=A0A4S4M7Q5_9AGAM|nr:hypothetical protein EW146_g807 [Bondarzewia mesenterica]